MHLLTEGLHEILLSRLVKLIISRIWRKRRRGHRFMAIAHCDRLRLCASERHHSLDPLDMGLVLFALSLLSLSCFALGCLRRCSRLELTSDELEIVRDFDPTFEEKQFEVARFVLQLDLVPVFQRFTDSASRSKHSQDLTPMRSLDPIETCHQGIFLLSRPRPTLAW